MVPKSCWSSIKCAYTKILPIYNLVKDDYFLNLQLSFINLVLQQIADPVCCILNMVIIYMKKLVNGWEKTYFLEKTTLKNVMLNMGVYNHQLEGIRAL